MFFPRTALAICLLAAASAEDWPQWRGPHRDGIGSAISEPKVWPEQLKLKWKVKVGEGHSSPVVAGGKIYLHSREGDREGVQCLRPENGQVIWQESYTAPYTVTQPPPVTARASNLLLWSMAAASTPSASAASSPASTRRR